MWWPAIRTLLAAERPRVLLFSRAANVPVTGPPSPAPRDEQERIPDRSFSKAALSGGPRGGHLATELDEKRHEFD